MTEPDPAEKKVKKKRHGHIGPNVRAMKVGKAFCPLCDSERISRITDRERESDKAARDSRKRQSTLSDRDSALSA